MRFALVLGACAAAAAAVVHGLVDNFYFVVDLAYAFWIVVLVLELATDRSPYSLDSPDRPIVQAAARNLDHAGGAS